ncbi:tRNA (guanine(46)-N(7))-methyltransferase TrmB [Gimibacter soli]|uniref:tRNA (guanine-N(7)-)-methyltransferase n=1 Tax=Gimibacter soli TaxID=3024400 RepID=A0AAF0BKG1_9PROT|nr:tRNA (guanine(46)-N(7))-methyltransferase TrmB [Gimibacter soli]WCL54239.1 tRNA (guanine(46)-N(7))-methyltransferase TrmB [Gimibacter soli]
MTNPDDIQKPGFQLPEQRYFGRRKGKPLTARKINLMETLLPEIGVPLPAGDDKKLDPFTLFGPEVTDIWFEVGFGKGEHLHWQAANHPHVGIIGCEPYLNGVAGLLAQIEDEKLANIRIYGDDARHVIWKLPDASVSRFFLLHPDPWPKTRHARRRFVNQMNLDDIARILKDGAEFRIGTDHPIYREWVNLQMSQRSDFEWLAEGPEDWLNRPDDWPETRYEAKALEGRATYFRFRRLPR